MIKIPKPDMQPTDLRSIVFGSPSGFLAFGFGSGLSPFAPGTMGTLVAIPFAIVLKNLDAPVFWAVLLLAFLVGVRVCTLVSLKIGTHDHGGIVWDEIVGYWLSIAFVPPDWYWLLLAFLIFRFFDVIKPWPIGWLDKQVSGGFGIMIDDTIAALFTAALLAMIQWFW